MLIKLLLITIIFLLLCSMYELAPAKCHLETVYINVGGVEIPFEQNVCRKFFGWINVEIAYVDSVL